MIAPDFTDYLLFGSRRCSICGAELPGCSDFFGADSSAPDGLTSACRNCRVAADRRRYRDQGEKERRRARRRGALS
jgi:hypothetical protein